MSTQPKALRLADALDAEFVQGRISNSTGRESAVELRRLHEALETEQEPVAWMHTTGTGHVYFRKKPQDKVFNPQPVYTVPPKKQWVGLTDDDVVYFRSQATFCDEFDAAFMAELIEKDLKEKNHG